MNRSVSLAAAAAILAACALATPAHATTTTSSTQSVRVMPLGDSITYGQGSCTGNGYRQPLAGLIAGQSRYSVDFVGSQQHGGMADPDHEGHPGYTIDQLRAGVDGWIKAAHPDVVLLDIGTNDMNQDIDQSHAADRATVLINQIFADQPGITIIMQGLVPTTPGWTYQGLSQPIAQYNSQLKQLQATEQQAGKHFTFVDAPALTPTNQADASHPSQMADGLRPNDAGYPLLAQNFFTALNQDNSAGWFTGGSPQASPVANTVHLVNLTPAGSLQNSEGDYSAGAWTSWSDMGASGMKDVTSAATYGVNHVLGIGADGHLYEKDGNYSTGQWSGWNVVTGSPTITAVTASSFGDTVHLAAIGTDGHFYNTDGVFPDGGWNGWTDHGAASYKRLASASTANNVNHIFAVDGDNTLKEIDANYCTGTWGGWGTAASAFTGLDVTASADGDTVHLDSIGANGHLYNTDGNFDTSQWNGWTDEGGTGLKRLTSANANGVNHIFAINSSNRLTEIDANYNTHTWNNWSTPAGGADSTGLTAGFTK